MLLARLQPTLCAGRVTAVTYTLLLQIVSCTKQDVGASAWSTTPCWKLQSTPLSLLPAAAYAPGSSNGSLVVYAALQDKSVHKYRLNLQALLTLKPKASPASLWWHRKSCRLPFKSFNTHAPKCALAGAAATAFAHCIAAAMHRCSSLPLAPCHSLAGWLAGLLADN